MQGGGLRGMPGGTRPHRCVRRSTRIPLEAMMLERCLTPGLGRSGEGGMKDCETHSKAAQLLTPHNFIC